MIFCFSCAPSTIEDLRFEAQKEIKAFVLELRQMETKEELQKALPILRRRFNQIADILLQVKRVEKGEKMITEHNLSEQIFFELARLYEIPGGKEIIESAQVEAIQRLRGISQ
jgi:hypothetical protein